MAVVEGSVYVLMDPSVPNLVKFGATENASRRRGAGLSMPSGIPDRCVVVYDELVSDIQQVKARIHQRFSAYRVEDRRDCFRIPVKAAVMALQSEACKFPIMPPEGERAEILSQLHVQYRYWIKDGVTSVAIVQLADAVLLEIVSSYPPGRGRTVEQVDMDVMGDHFDPSDPIEVNVAKFLELDEVDLINVTPLFEDEVARKIDEAHNRYLESIE
ncbi:GIY-YIG nuclease family protein [Geodermatophilus sp. SYSU D01180]